MPELLVVIAILLILAGLAVENYALAQIRAKVARTKTELRQMALAVEAYSVDHNRPPRMRSWEFYKDPHYDEVWGEKVNGNLSQVVTTPVAYVSDVLRFDPFMESNRREGLDERLYTYQDIRSHTEHEPESAFWPGALEFYGAWRLCSVGPDQTFGHGFSNSAQLPYDPTNGLISAGNIWYSPKVPFDGPFPPADLLGAH